MKGRDGNEEGSARRQTDERMETLRKWLFSLQCCVVYCNHDVGC